MLMRGSEGVSQGTWSQGLTGWITNSRNYGSFRCPIVASMCRAADPSKITTFCAAVTKPEGGTDNFGDDQTHARTVADHLGVKLIEVPTDADLIAELPSMVWQLDEPTADFAAVQTLLLARAARENGMEF